MPISRSDEAFAELRRLLGAHREVVDEVAFFETVSHHLYLPLDFFREAADLLKRRIATLKRDGIPSVGINVLTTLGHINEGWDVFPPLPFQPMIGHDGRVSKSCGCPYSPELRRYVAEKYRLFARAHPDFIWVDDDIRCQHHGVDFGCFCPSCLARFANTVGRRFTRAALARALSRPDGGSIRQAWVAQNGRSLDSLMACVERAVHRVNPQIQTGLMTSPVLWNSYSGADCGRRLTTLRARKVRPGGGFYTDERPLEMVDKTLEIGRQCVGLPKTVNDIQYELENFPYGPLGKSRRALISECALALAVGCNGIAFNAVAMGYPGRQALRAKAPLFRAVAAARPFWEELAAHAADYPVTGFRPAWHPQLATRRRVRPGQDWFAWDPLYDIVRANGLARLGVPLSPAREGGGVILSGRHAEAFTDAALRAMLAGPLLLDAYALEVLEERGLGALTGVRLVGWQDNGMAERLTADPLNGAMAGGLRDIRAEFWGDPFMVSARLQPLSPRVRVLSVLETYLGERREPCVTAFENARGGRVVVLGHAPWRFLDGKRPQILNAVDWAMRGKLPVRIRETVPVVPLVRLAANRHHGVIVLLNAGLDVVRGLTVEVRAPATKVRLAAPGRTTVSLKPTKETNGWSVRLRDLGPWQVAALLLGSGGRGARRW